MKRVLPVVAMVAIAACARPNPDSLLKRAASEYADQDYAAARNDSVAVLKLRPSDKQATLLLARTLLRLGDGDGAQSAIDQLKAMGMSGEAIVRMDAEAQLARGLPKQAIETLAGDRSADAWRIVAAARLKLADSAGALEAYKAGLAAGGGYLLSLDYARFLLANDDPTGAEQQLQAMMALDPHALATLLLAGDVYTKLGRLGEAHAAWQDAARRHPNRVEPLLAEANQFDSESKVDDAIRLVEQAAKLDPDNPAVIALQIQLASEKGDWEKVRSMLAPRETTLEPLSADYMAYAEALLRLGHPEQARAMFQRALEMSPNNPYSRMMAGEAQLATGDANAAWQTLKPLAESVLSDPHVLELAEKAARAAGDPAADALAARLKSGQLEQARQLAQQGQAALARRDWAGAIGAYRQLLTMGNDAEVHKRLAYAMSNSGNHDGAIAEADKALALDPDNADMMHMAGLTRFNARRDQARALQLLQAAVDRDPRSELFRTDLARAKAGRG